MKYRPINVEVSAPITLGAAITVSEANVVRAVNTAGAASYLVSIVDTSNNTVGTMTLAAYETVLIDKPKSYKVFAADVAVKLSSVTYP
jgi:hypothetical protein